jgi:hypothetical protein
MSTAATRPSVQPLPHGFFAALVLALLMVDALLGYVAWEAVQALVR